jgi:hypothetical protein
MKTIMKKLLIYFPFIALLFTTACEKDKIIDPPPINRIDYLLVDEKEDDLLIYGQFPDEKGVITLDGIALPIKTWSRALVVCDKADNGKQAYGNVVVQSGDSKSVPRRLYKWFVIITSKRPHGGLSSDALEIATANITIRGDAKPAPKHVLTEGYPELFRLGYVHFEAVGVANSQYDCGTVVSEWQKTVIQVPLSKGMLDLPAQTHFQGTKAIRPNGFDVALDFQAWETIPTTLTITTCGANSTVNKKMMSSQVVGLDGFDPIPLRFDEKNKIKSDSIHYKVYNSTQLMWQEKDGEKYARNATLSWQAIRFPIEE